jgi:hypothetical protein
MFRWTAAACKRTRAPLAAREGSGAALCGGCAEIEPGITAGLRARVRGRRPRPAGKIAGPRHSRHPWGGPDHDAPETAATRRRSICCTASAPRARPRSPDPAPHRRDHRRSARSSTTSSRATRLTPVGRPREALAGFPRPRSSARPSTTPRPCASTTGPHLGDDTHRRPCDHGERQPFRRRSLRVPGPRAMYVPIMLQMNRGHGRLLVRNRSDP